MGLSVKNGSIADEAREAVAKLIERLSDVAEQLRFNQSRDQMRIVKVYGTPTGATLDITDQIAVAGSCWFIERITVSANPGANSQFELYIDEIQPQNLLTNLAVNAVTGMGTQVPANGIYLPGGARLIVRFTNQAAGVTAAANLQVRQLMEVE